MSVPIPLHPPSPPAPLTQPWSELRISDVHRRALVRDFPPQPATPNPALPHNTTPKRVARSAQASKDLETVEGDAAEVGIILPEFTIDQEKLICIKFVNAMVGGHDNLGAPLVTTHMASQLTAMVFPGHSPSAIEHWVSDYHKTHQISPSHRGQHHDYTDIFTANPLVEAAILSEVTQRILNPNDVLDRAQQEKQFSRKQRRQRRENQFASNGERVWTRIMWGRKRGGSTLCYDMTGHI